MEKGNLLTEDPTRIKREKKGIETETKLSLHGHRPLLQRRLKPGLRCNKFLFALSKQWQRGKKNLGGKKRISIPRV